MPSLTNNIQDIVMNQYQIKESLTQWANDNSEVWLFKVNSAPVARTISNKETLLSLLTSFTRRKIESSFTVEGFTIDLQIDNAFASLFDCNVKSGYQARLYDTLAQLMSECYFTDTFSFEPTDNEYGRIFDVFLPKLGVTIQVKRTKTGYYWPIHD